MVTEAEYNGVYWGLRSRGHEEMLTKGNRVSVIWNKQVPEI
jgi:hypothetical protein